MRPEADDIARLFRIKRRKRLKMKPPWSLVGAAESSARGRGQEVASTRGSLHSSSGGASLLSRIVVCLIVCDIVSEQSVKVASYAAASKLSLPGDERPGPIRRLPEMFQVGDELNEVDQSRASTGHEKLQLRPSELAHRSSGPQSIGAHFNLGQMPRLIASSSYQSEVYLPCQIINLDDDQTVSWIRKRDSLVLTVDKTRLVEDSRFELNQAPDDWTLILSRPTEQDGGLYECQVSSMEPKLSHLVELRMVRAESSISNISSLFVRPADLINLTCSIETPQATSYVYWYKNKQVVHFDNLRLRAGSQNEHSKPDQANGTSPFVRHKTAFKTLAKPEAEGQVQWSRSSSTLIIREARLNDTANYTCLPANAKPSHIRVVVVENGLGSQPEKRSLQADCAFRSALIRSPLTQLWLTILRQASYLEHLFTGQPNVETERETGRPADHPELAHRHEDISSLFLFLATLIAVYIMA